MTPCYSSTGGLGPRRLIHDLSRPRLIPCSGRGDFIALVCPGSVGLQIASSHTTHFSAERTWYGHLSLWRTPALLEASSLLGGPRPAYIITLDTSIYLYCCRSNVLDFSQALQGAFIASGLLPVRFPEAKRDASNINLLARTRRKRREDFLCIRRAKPDDATDNDEVGFRDADG